MAWAVGGPAVGLLATLIATPIQLSHMGAERYGIVVITTATVSALLWVDGGVGWAVMRAVPWHRARGDRLHARRLAGSGVVVTALLGCIAGAAIWILAPAIVDLFRLSAPVRPLAVATLHVAAFTLPLSLLLNVVSSVARAAGDFRIPAVSIAFWVVALNVAWALAAGEPDDVVVIARAQLAITAAALVFVLAAVWVRARDYLFPLRPPSLGASRELLAFGGKSTLGAASLVLLYNADKLALATVLPVSILPAYSIPFSVAVRIQLVARALATVLLPRLSAISSRGDSAELRRVGMAALRLVALVSPAIAITCVFGGRAFLELWVDHDFAARAWGPLIALAVGFGALAAGLVGQSMLDASGRPGITATLTAGGTALGIGSALALAGAFGTALAAAIGIALGLVTIATAALEMSRRLALRISRGALLRVVVGPWLIVGAAGAVAFGVSRALSASPLVTLLLVALASVGTATWSGAFERPRVLVPVDPLAPHGPRRWAGR